MQQLTSSDIRESLFAGNGEMAALMRSHDWSQTPLGDVEQWPQSLRTTVSILLNSRYPMFTFWGDHLVKLYNDAYRPVLGLTKHPQALGCPAPEIWPDIWDAIGPLVEQVITTGEATWFDNFQLFMQRSGYLEETYFTFSYSPIRDETGGIGGLFCACTETTKQVLSDRRLRTLRDLAAQAGKAKTPTDACEIAMTTLANNAADIPFALLYLLDGTGKQAELAGRTGLIANTSASPQLVNLTDLTGFPVWPLAKVAHTAQLAKVTDVIEQFGTLPAGLWQESPHTALVLPVASPGQERPAGIMVVGISSRRALDDDYQGFLELVAGQVASAIADARVYEAERQRAEALAEIDRAKTVFFSNVSHEFRTPLTLILAPLEDALSDAEIPLPPRQRDRLEIVQRHSLRLLKLVNTLLDFSRIEVGRIQAVYEPTDLATFTADLASTFRSLIERAGISLVVECSPLSTAVYVDREMWEKIVFNLLSNAFKFTFTGTITVHLQDFTDHVELIIADTGIGIPVDEIPQLFARFHRVRGAKGRSFEGSGIGLSLVQELVKLHGGSISVTSALGQGSCLTVSIPTGFVHLPSDRLTTSRTLASTAMGATAYLEEAWGWLPIVEEQEDKEITLSPPPPPLPSPAKILLVDDNADMREYVKRLLKQRYEVTAVEDGLAALVAIRQSLPDLVLTDVMMPRLDGFGLLQALRQDQTTRELPIILLSARAGEEARIEGLEAGADDYLTKPFSTRELLARVEASLKMAQIRQEAAQQEQALRLIAEQAQQEAEATAQRLSHILESMSDAFLALDQDWRIIYQNAAAEQVNNGIPRTQVLGKTHWEAWPASVGSQLEYQYRYAMTQQIPVHFEYHYYDPPEYDVWVEIHAYPSTEGLGIFYRDIGDRKRAEAELKQSKEQLEIRVAERTAELNQLNLDIEASLQEKEVLLKEIHHRVKNNLSIVSSLLQMQCRRTQDTAATAILQDSQNRIASIALVHEKLYRSKDLANINISQYIPDLTTHLFDSYNVNSQQIKLRLEIEDASLDIENAVSFGLIINELVSNALKYAFPSHITGEILVKLYQETEQNLILIVQDNGVGLPLEFNGKKAKTLGITLVQGLVKQLGGNIEISSQPGTKFKITFIKGRT
ncbi:ATP-binding protein [Nostoc sp. TCL26-01]|uniref:ATP-binding protein n=1 Tax=Nostoc sp. TCL26-01 TaxID=2576904 RepID=UPI0015BD7CD5|nr:ATP-binding protein [Nostoc sp. TCL26-01]QLE58331.1 response regulator [Nostoc sp. TCL26-01]